MLWILRHPAQTRRKFARAEFPAVRSDTPGTHLDESGRSQQQGALASPARPDDRADPPGLEGGTHAVQCADLLCAAQSARDHVNN